MCEILCFFKHFSLQLLKGERGRRRRKIGNYEIEKYVFMSKNLHIAISDLRRTNDILCCLEKKIQLHTNTEL